jgi:hypothetical protein
MPLPVQNLSLRQVREYRAALQRFLNAYRAYVSAGPHGPGELRSRANAAIPQADMAIQAAGVHLAVTPPPIAPGPVMHDLANVAFLHERPGWQGSAAQTVGLVNDAIEQADVYLHEMGREVERQRKRPTYWLDRGVRLLLGIPAYLISVLVGVPQWRVDGSWVGIPLRLFSLAAEGFGVFVGGRALGWW